MRSALNPGPLKPQGRRPPRVSSSPFELTPAPLDSYGLHRQHRHDAHMLHTHGCTLPRLNCPWNTCSRAICSISSSIAKLTSSFRYVLSSITRSILPHTVVHVTRSSFSNEKWTPLLAGSASGVVEFCLGRRWVVSARVPHRNT